MGIGHSSEKGYHHFFLRIGPIFVDFDFYWWKENYCEVTFGLFLDLERG